MHGHPTLRGELSREAKIIHYLVQKPWEAAPLVTGGSEIWWNASTRTPSSSGVEAQPPRH